MKRTIIKIDRDLCYGCGKCVRRCYEGALQIIDNKAVIISELYCDGLGTCIGTCPVNAITFEEREAEPYDEAAVMERMIPKGKNVILAHLEHLKSNGADDFYQQALDYLKQHNIAIDSLPEKKKISIGTLRPVKSGCGKTEKEGRQQLNTDSLENQSGQIQEEYMKLQRNNKDFHLKKEKISISTLRPVKSGCGAMLKTTHESPGSGYKTYESGTKQIPERMQFPVQLHLINPDAGFFKNSDLLIAADCTAFASGEFHSRFLQEKSLAIACPKLDSNLQLYKEKLTKIIDKARINTLTVLIMEVPCCIGLVKIATTATENAERNIPINIITLSLQGNIKNEEWIEPDLW